MKMSFIWNNPDWPSYTHGVEEVERHHVRYEVQKNATDIVFNIIDPDMKNRMHARSLTDEIVSSLAIEGEKISYDSVYSSICKQLDINLETKAKTGQYQETWKSYPQQGFMSGIPFFFPQWLGSSPKVSDRIGKAQSTSAKEMAET